ncbi:hypothetical protein ACET9D_18295, partial [Aeromonas veronii]
MDDKTPKVTDKCENINSESSSVNKALTPIVPQQSALGEHLAAMARPSAIDKALQSFTSQHSAIDK